MGSAGNQNPWSPYDYKDCSLGVCSIYCPQFCYFIFPPPPPPDDSAAPFSPLIIAIIGVLASAFILVSYYTIVTRYCKRQDQNTSGAGEELHGEVARDQWRQAAAGLEEAVIKTITVCKYQKGDGLIEGTECAVCLSEFQENEPLRLLPKCSHAFHLPCIDTWLKSHSNCPLCRANVVGEAHALPLNVDSYEFQRPNDLILVVDDQEQHCLVGGGRGGGGGEAKSPNRDDGNVAEIRNQGIELRRSVSLGTLPSQRHIFEIGEFGEGIANKRCESGRDIGSSKWISVEERNSECNSSVSLMLVDHNKGKNIAIFPN
ncbi:hypothetical protein C2S53_010512 [Perilla frutescens var. hirtella]|uniref:RING-type E3 ubiquitin transferase n=1 Tax=Perilla frutescens var. hirtella TaxID=608512 RepID=A0AAD4IMT1_PERFH|nr:hypothetical protein C2S53_010512 [Perilla frutescens var. hirtella]